MKIILFYDNLIRDYRALLLLSAVLKKLGHKLWIHALWDNSIDFIKKINPDTVVMGQVMEYTTSLIGEFVCRNNINLVINTSESVAFIDKLDLFFKFNFKELNEQYITMQVIPSRDIYELIMKSDIIDKNKYKFIGFPRMDLSVDKYLFNEEEKHLRKKYNINNYERIILYVSSFIMDDAGGQVSEENKDSFDVESFIKREKRLKHQHEILLSKLLKNPINKNSILLIKKHPWDKSSYFEDTYACKNCIVLDVHEYIAPIIRLADYILHTESTSAIEAWIQKKKTISILPDFDGDRRNLRNHMKYEVIVRNYDELISAIKNYPVPGPAQASLKIYEPFLDGKATIRLAHEINKLKPKHDKTIFNKNVSLRKFILSGICEITKFFKNSKYDLSKMDRNNYLYHFILSETKKSEVLKLYKKPIRKYISSNIKLIRC